VKTDVLSDVLRAVHLTGAVYFDFELSSPWVLEAPPAQAIAERMMPGAQRVIEYHLIARGSCWGHAIGQEPIRLSRGGILSCFRRATRMSCRAHAGGAAWSAE
jgi:hypothetical protein